jgi:predicted nucleotidyltransferase component of viral defense system
MIQPGEIQKRANAVGVRDTQIEKDYMLSWILFGISQHNELSKILVFKGGTVLKKVYFKDYRFSEDLDFTLTGDHSNDQLFEWFEQVFVFVKEEANIPLEIIGKNDFDDGGMNFFIKYIGPMGGVGSHKKVKVDISRSEQLVFDPLLKDVILEYSDQKAHKLLCYCLEEVLVEKLRATIQRMEARDFYDIWYLLEIHEMDIDFYIEEFKEKCGSKHVDFSAFHNNIKKRIPQYMGRWELSMKDQIKDLPDFDSVLREVNRHFKKFII